ncbi:MAG: YqeG family HAD IIIA-type phosphatase [Lactobacillales bacterium]|jgi:HAD superfamily phosphatase (TIGR01668 family)|nr:YqeG family HAD IIIA-type phosphatase [Lactobacillales bacterium]
MLRIFKPTYLLNKVTDIKPARLKELGIKAILADVDNTLVAWHDPYGSPEILEWIRDIYASGLEIILVSNNTTKRVAKVSEQLGVDGVAWSLKPLPRGVNKALKRLGAKGVTKKEVIMIGDQMLTDILSANLLGVDTVLVRQLVASDLAITRINRIFERKIVGHFTKKHPEDFIWKDSL